MGQALPMNAKANARTASEDVAEQIRAQIATGRLKPGDMLPSETALLDLFKVARPTMREALRVLESDGLVKIERGIKGGARVQEPEVDRLARRVGLHLQLRGADLRDLMQAQVIIQPGLVALAAAARTDDDLADLRRLVDRVEACTNMREFAEAAAAFLDRVIHAGHNQVLALLSELTSELLSKEIGSSLLSEHWLSERDDLIPWCVEQYGTLVDLLEQRDAAEAEAFWFKHLHEVGAEQAGTAPLTVYPWAARRAPLRAAGQ
jgi:GntR family transcriptional repressor for pyruvate dehydrogenase complex